MDECLRAMNEAIANKDHLLALKHALNAERMTGSKMCPQFIINTVDHLAAACLLHANSTAGYSGRVLTVRPPASGTEWLGGHAPPDPLQDDPVFYKSLPPVPDTKQPIGALPWLSRSSPSNQGASAAELAGHTRLALATHRPSGYRCLAHAIQAASDGDVIVLLEGTHTSGSGREEEGGVVVEKRLLIKGQGKVLLEHRSNTPLLRLRRGVVLQDVTIDMVGFRECLRCEEGQPLLLRCVLQSSGGDALHVTGTSQPTLVDCTLQAKHTGVQAWSVDCTRFSTLPRSSTASGQVPGVILSGCTITKCGGPALSVTGSSFLALKNCHIMSCGQEGIVVSGRATAALAEVQVTQCKGPALDASDNSHVMMQRCIVNGCGGGVWLWDAAQLTVHGPGKVECMSSEPAVLLEGAIRSNDRMTCTSFGATHTFSSHNNTANNGSERAGGVLRAEDFSTVQLFPCGTTLQATSGITGLNPRHACEHARVAGGVLAGPYVPMCPVCDTMPDGDGAGVDVAVKLTGVKVLGRVVLSGDWS